MPYQKKSRKSSSGKKKELLLPSRQGYLKLHFGKTTEQLASMRVILQVVETSAFFFFKFLEEKRERKRAFLLYYYEFPFLSYYTP